jgi:hypothetical protein
MYKDQAINADILLQLHKVHHLCLHCFICASSHYYRKQGAQELQEGSLSQGGCLHVLRTARDAESC